MMQDKSEGTLYIVSTPIGNLEDITLRALRVLKEVDLIAAEDTRRTRQLLTHYGIQKPLISYHEHNERMREDALLEKLREGKNVALVTDAGTPGISDPGEPLIRRAIREKIPLVPIPGPAAAMAALSIGGLPTDRFLFYGFLPAKSSARQKESGRAPEKTRDPHLLRIPPAAARISERGPGNPRGPAGGGGPRDHQNFRGDLARDPVRGIGKDRAGRGQGRNHGYPGGKYGAGDR